MDLNCINLLVFGILIAPSMAVFHHQISPQTSFGIPTSASLVSFHNENLPSISSPGKFVPGFHRVLADEKYAKFLEKNFNKNANPDYREFIGGEMKKEKEKEFEKNVAPGPNHPRKLLVEPKNNEGMNKNEKKEEKKMEERELLGTVEPVSYQAKIIWENHCPFKIMPAVLSKDDRYKENNNPGMIKNLENGQWMDMGVPFDIDGLETWPRINCRDDGTHCTNRIGECEGSPNNHVNCLGHKPLIPPVTTILLNLRQSKDHKDPIKGMDYYEVVPFSEQQNLHVKVIPTSTNGRCKTLETTNEVKTEKCDNREDLGEHVYTILFCPS